ncbi:MAG: hypothetical protein ACNA7Y_03435 [Gammaproteobacteria bacterium]
MINIFKKFAEFILQSRFGAILTVVFLVFLPLFRWAGWTVLGLVTLRKGALEGSFVLAGVVLSVIVAGFLMSINPLPPGMSRDLMVFGMAGILATGLWVWILANVLRNTASWSRVFQVVMWVGLSVVALVQLIYPEVAVTWWLPIVKENLVRMQKSLPEMTISDGLSTKIATLMTGGYATLTLLAALFGLWVARWLQALLYNPGGLGQELMTIRLGVLEAAIAVMITLWIMMGDEALVIGFVPVIGLVFIVAGFSLVHRLLGMMKKPWIGAAAFYIILFVLFRYMIFFLISLALIDAVVNVRKRLLMMKR